MMCLFIEIIIGVSTASSNTIFTRWENLLTFNRINLSRGHRSVRTEKQ